MLVVFRDIGANEKTFDVMLNRNELAVIRASCRAQEFSLGVYFDSHSWAAKCGFACEQFRFSSFKIDKAMMLGAHSLDFTCTSLIREEWALHSQLLLRRPTIRLCSEQGQHTRKCRMTHRLPQSGIFENQHGRPRGGYGRLS